MIINLTPHTVNVISESGETVKEYPASGMFARAFQTEAHIGELEGVELVSMTFGAPVGLPDFEEGVYYIVSAILISAARASGRTTADLLLTADPVRNEAGQIIGCRKFALA